MPYYYTCPNCGSNLDPGERCDCISYGAALRLSTETVNRRNNQNNYKRPTKRISFLSTERSNYGKRKQA